MVYKKLTKAQNSLAEQPHHVTKPKRSRGKWLWNMKASVWYFMLAMRLQCSTETAFGNKGTWKVSQELVMSQKKEKCFHSVITESRNGGLPHCKNTTGKWRKKIKKTHYYLVELINMAHTLQISYAIPSKTNKNNGICKAVSQPLQICHVTNCIHSPSPCSIQRLNKPIKCP